MSLLRFLESWAEGLLRIVIGIGLAWIGVVEGAGYGAFLEVVGTIFIAAGIAEIWFVEVAVHAVPNHWRTRAGQRGHEPTRVKNPRAAERIRGALRLSMTKGHIFSACRVAVRLHNGRS